jgi:oligo-1,6-glucosidase
MLLGTLSGTLFVYQGQEIGMTNHPTSWTPSDLRDVDSLNYLKDIEERYPGNEDMEKRAWKAICDLGRDNSRTPVQWSSNSKTSAGFTDEGVEPWMKVNENFKEVNVESQLNDPNSIRSFWKKMIQVRKNNEALFVHGKYEVVDPKDEKAFVFLKREIVEGKETGRVACIVLNWGSEEQKIELPEAVKGRKMDIVTSNGDGHGEMYGPWEGRVYAERA